MSDQSLTAYDQGAYPSLAHVQTHPDRLATIAALFGMQLRRSRNVACWNSDVVMAPILFPWPTGFRKVSSSELMWLVARSLKATNHRRSFTEQCPASATGSDGVRCKRVAFDYIIAHGVYSWVPDPVRDRILAICSEFLSPNGVAYVSYNTYPGGHIRDMVREMMLFHVRDAADAEQKIAQGRALMKFLAGSKKEPDLYRQLLAKELEHAIEYSDGAFYHDDLNPLTRPIYFHHFVEHAAAHGLQFLGDAMFQRNAARRVPASRDDCSSRAG